MTIYSVIRSTAITCAVAGLLGLGGCASVGVPGYGLKPGVNTMKDVRNRIGMPSNIRFDDEGNEVWEYNNNPVGYYAYRLIFDQNNVIKEGRRFRVQTDQHQVRAGMSAQEVTQIMGEPSLIYYIRGSRHWEWRVHRAGSLQHRMITQFDNEGRVLGSVFVGATYRGSNAAAGHGGISP